MLQGIAAAKSDEAARVSDQEIRADVIDRLHREAGVRDEHINVTVVDGIVHLWGAVQTRSELEAARVVVENARGIRGLKNHLREVALPSGGV